MRYSQSGRVAIHTQVRSKRTNATSFANFTAIPVDYIWMSTGGQEVRRTRLFRGDRAHCPLQYVLERRTSSSCSSFFKSNVSNLRLQTFLTSARCPRTSPGSWLSILAWTGYSRRKIGRTSKQSASVSAPDPRFPPATKLPGKLPGRGRK